MYEFFLGPVLQRILLGLFTTKPGIIDGKKYQENVSALFCYPQNFILYLFVLVYSSKNKLDGDTSIMTYKGHVVIKTLVRCRFSPIETTGQRFIYTGCGVGRVVSK